MIFSKPQYTVSTPAQPTSPLTLATILYYYIYSARTMSTLTILSLLDAYSQIHDTANQSLKVCTWEITKARQNKGRRGALTAGVLMAGDVREELRATKILKDMSDAVEPSSLVDEDTTTTTSKAEKKASSLDDQPLTRHFVLTDVHDELLQKNQDDSHPNKNDNDDTATGLRRRKGKEENEEGADHEWTVVPGVDPEKAEEERLLSADPLDLFGAMPPQELRKAQEEARKALAGYVEAANLIAAIQERLPATAK